MVMQIFLHWHKLSRDTVDAPSLEVRRARLDKAPGKPGVMGGVLAHVRGWIQMGAAAPSNRNHSAIL